MKETPAPYDVKLDVAVNKAQGPYDIDAESALLGILLLFFKQESLDDVQRYITVKDFYQPAHQYIFQAILSLFDSGSHIDTITVLNELRSKNLITRIGGASYLARLTSSSPNTFHIEEYTRIVYEHALRRKLLGMGDFIRMEALDFSKTIESIMEKTEQDVFAMNQSHQVAPYQESKILVKETMSLIGKRKDSGTFYTGVQTQFMGLDILLAGLQDSEMIVVGARPSVGKTALALSMVDNIAVKQRISCGFFSLEMPAVHLMQRLLASQAKVNSKKLRNPSSLSTAEWGSLNDAASRIYEAPIYVDDTPNIRLIDLRSQARRMKSVHDIKVLFIDYLGLITVDTKAGIPRYEQMAMVSRSTKALARELSIPVVILSQLRRDSEGKEPNLSDLRETGAIEQDADVVMFLHRAPRQISNEQEQEQEFIETKLILSKQRNGPVGIVKLAFIPKYARYEAME